MLPSVDQLLAVEELDELIREHGHDLAVDGARQALDEARQAIRAGETAPGLENLAQEVVHKVEDLVRPTLRPVINATGVIIHTNLGRAPLSRAAMQAMHAVTEGYSNLEYSLESGARGSRYVHAEALLRRLSGAEAALIVNNNAAAVLLMLSTFARGKDVIIARGQLVEIGGGFRIPDVMRQSGVRLVEVGTTNRTYVRDYEEAITEDTVALMRVHHSNFRQSGFVHEASLEELVDLACANDLLALDDLGSGTFLDTAVFGLAHEPMVQESVSAGADLISFSGDKLLGGPQGGLIVGKRKALDRLKKFPMTRALRVDKTTLAALQATLLHYVKDEAAAKVPVWRMIAMGLEEIQARAQEWAGALREVYAVEVVEGRSTVGGGSLPGETLPTRLVALRVPSPDELAGRLREKEPPLIGRIDAERLVLDPRTVLPEQDGALLSALRSVGPNP